MPNLIRLKQGLVKLKSIQENGFTTIEFTPIDFVGEKTYTYVDDESDVVPYQDLYDVSIDKQTFNKIKF